MKRQALRKTILMVSFLFFPITIYYFSPVIIVYAAGQGIITGSFILFALLFLSALFLGRGFCGWVCPAGSLQEWCGAIKPSKAKGGKGDWIKYFIWAPWMISIIALAVRAGGYHAVDPLYLTAGGISVADPSAYIIYYLFIALIVIVALAAGQRGFCHYVCWMAPFMIIGGKVRALFGIPSLHLEAAALNCKSCGLCSKECPMGLDVQGSVKEGNMYNQECILCGRCVDRCPGSAIKYSFRR